MTSEKPLKIKSASSKKSIRSALGAPSQHNQSSRKGKKAWRKNVDIGEVEQGLEGLRQEERVTGYTTVLSFISYLIKSDISCTARFYKS
jgi:nucleolar protein 53